MQFLVPRQFALLGILMGPLAESSLVGQSARPASAIDLAKVRGELHSLFDRDPGQPLGDPQAQALARFLERYAGQDLGPYGYAKAMECYFRRDARSGAILLDEHFVHFPSIEHEEHAAMAGRMYLLALREHSAPAPAERIESTTYRGWCERTAMLFPDLDLLGGVVPGLLRNAADRAPLRLAMVRGVLRNRAEEAAKDRFLAKLYAPETVDERDTVRPTNDATGPGNAEQISAGHGERKPLVVGQQAPPLPIDAVVQGDTNFDLANLRGKVVVLDFFASWSPPCRTGIPELQKLVGEAGDATVVIGVTRLHGRGMDFHPGSKPPHGGKLVASLDREAELALNRRFATAFGIEHPLVLTTEAGMQDYGVELLPTMVVLDRDGKLLGSIRGNGPESLRQLRALLSAR